MRKRDWGGTVLVACLIALAGLLHDHTVLLVLLSAAAIASAAVIVRDARGRNQPAKRERQSGISVNESIKAEESIETDGPIEAGESIDAGGRIRAGVAAMDRQQQRAQLSL